MSGMFTRPIPPMNALRFEHTDAHDVSVAVAKKAKAAWQIARDECETRDKDDLSVLKVI